MPRRLDEAPGKPHLSFTEKSVIKHGPPDAIAAEAARTQHAHEIGLSSGLFRVPRVVSVDVEQGRLELERLYGLAHIQRLAAYAPPAHSIWSRLGVVLAVIHAELDPPNCPRVPLPDPWCAPRTEEVHIHGDFNCRNINYVPQDNTIVVLDWTLSAMVGGLSTVGSRWFDVAWFVSSLFFLRRRLIFPRGIEEKADRFLGAYVSKSGCRTDKEVLSRFTWSAHLLRLAKQAPSLFKRAAHVSSSRRLRRYLKRGFN